MNKPNVASFMPTALTHLLDVVDAHVIVRNRFKTDAAIVTIPLTQEVNDNRTQFIVRLALFLLVRKQ